MSVTARYLSKQDKVSIVIGKKRILATPREADELLAELQVLYHERNMHDDGERTD